MVFFHLPTPSGKYIVGCLDIFSRPRDGKLSLLYRLYYPTSCKVDHSRFPAWLPHARYAEAYVAAKWPVPPCRTTIIDRLKHTLSARAISILAWGLRWISGDPKIFAIESGKPVNGRFPLVLFSHGLIACRTTYSSLCTDIASHGYIVAAIEHGDKSACVRMHLESPDGEVSWVEREELPAGAPEGELRAKQLDYREKEVIECLYSLKDIDNGKTNDYFIQHSNDEEKVNACLDWFKGLIATEKAIMAGHSMGGATTIRCMTNHEQHFLTGVALDSWMFPLKEETKMPNTEKLLFVNYERFQGEKNLTTMKKYEANCKGVEGNSNVITIKNARHYACTDILVAFQGATIGRLLFGKQDPNFNSYDGLVTSSELFLAWVHKHRTEENMLFEEILRNRNNHLFTGISLKTKSE